MPKHRIKKMSFRKTDKNDRVMIFLDLANIELGLRNYDGLENCSVDHEELASNLIDGRKVTGAITFGTKEYFRQYREQSEYLSEIGYKIVYGHREDGMQKEVDVSLAVELLMHAYNDHYDVAILISGDRDYIPAISAVQSLGKQVEVAAFNESVSYQVVNVSDKFTDVAKMPVIFYNPPEVEESFECDLEAEGISNEFMDLNEVINEAKASMEAE